MGYRLQQNSMTLNDLEHLFTALSTVVSVIRAVAKRLKWHYTSTICILSLTT